LAACPLVEVFAGVVGLVGQHLGDYRSGKLPVLQYLMWVRAVVGFAVSQVEGKRQAVEIRLEVDLGGETTAGAAERPRESFVGLRPQGLVYRKSSRCLTAFDCSKKSNRVPVILVVNNVSIAHADHRDVALVVSFFCNKALPMTGELKHNRVLITNLYLGDVGDSVDPK